LCVWAAAIEVVVGVLSAVVEVGRDEGREEIASTLGVGARGSAGVGGCIPVNPRGAGGEEEEHFKGG
jgi:hypothetical protein